ALRPRTNNLIIQPIWRWLGFDILRNAVTKYSAVERIRRWWKYQITTLALNLTYPFHRGASNRPIVIPQVQEMQTISPSLMGTSNGVAVFELKIVPSLHAIDITLLFFTVCINSPHSYPATHGHPDECLRPLGPPFLNFVRVDRGEV